MYVYVLYMHVFMNICMLQSMSTEVVLSLMGEIATKNYGVDDCDNVIIIILAMMCMMITEMMIEYDDDDDKSCEVKSTVITIRAVKAPAAAAVLMGYFEV